MMRHQVIVELSAQQDIAEAYLWLAERSPDAAGRWFNGLHDTMGSLELFPERCPLAPECEFFDAEIREIFHGRRQHKYRILFTVSKGEVHVLHVRHGARRALGDPEPGEE
jgi:plasmid stabilization system protein ParE